MKKLLKCRQVLSSRRVAKVFVLILLFFIVTNFVTEWKNTSFIDRQQETNRENYQAIVSNAILLNRCYVEKPDENYCFQVLRIISGQLNDASFATENLKLIWLNTYVYLGSVALEKLPEKHDRIVTIALNEGLVEGNESQFKPSAPDKVRIFQQELRATYRARIATEMRDREHQKYKIDNEVKQEKENETTRI